jgi:hypothetical protein
MIECRYCGEVFYAEPERVGARCRRCREPLYERREAAPHEPVAADASCSAHPRTPAVGACQGCGAHVCSVCRTRWRQQVLCPACFARAAEAKEVRPEESRAHRRQALLGVIFGVLAWAMTVGAAFLVLWVRPGARGDGPTVVAGLLGLTSFLPSLFGVGQAAAAVRARGERLTLGTYGLVLCAAHIGALVGVLLLTLWQR